MAFTRAFLRGLGVTDEQLTAIMEEHVSLMDEIKAERDSYKTQAENLQGIEKQFEELKKEDWKSKYEKEKKDFSEYKTGVETEKTTQLVKDAYKKLLTDSKVGENHIGSILRVTDFSNMKLKDDGTLEDADKLKESIKTDWSGFIATQRTEQSSPETPPSNDPSKGQSRAAQLEAQYHSNLYGKGE